MPLLLHKEIGPEGELGIWDIAEDESWFLEQLALFEEEINQLQTMSAQRRLEWLAGRYLLHKMSGRAIRGACLKDEFGKPYLENSPYQISLSHSHNKVAVLAAPPNLGIDIQYLVAKIERIAPKYMRDVEFESLTAATRLEHLHVYWGAKEVLYKAYGRKKLDFRGHIHITPFEYDLSVGKATGIVTKGDFKANYEIHYERIDDFILVWGVELG